MSSSEAPCFSLGHETLKVSMRMFADNRRRLVERLCQCEEVPGDAVVVLQGGEQKQRYCTDVDVVFRQVGGSCSACMYADIMLLYIETFASQNRIVFLTYSCPGVLFPLVVWSDRGRLLWSTASQHWTSRLVYTTSTTRLCHLDGRVRMVVR